MSAHIISPKERAFSYAAGELVATVNKILWEGDEGESIIFSTPHGEKIVVDGGAGSIEEGETYRLLGSYTNNPQYGKQFKATSWLAHASHDAKGVVKYLASNCDGIGQVTAKRLWDAYLGGAVKILREDPNRVAKDGLLDPAAAELASAQLQAVAAFEATTIDLHSLLSGRGFGSSAVAACIGRWKLNAARVVQKNPFAMLLARIPRASFSSCDRIYLESGGDSAALKRQVLAGWNEIAQCDSGSTWHPRMVFDRGIAKQLGEGKGRPDEALALATRRAWGIGPMVRTHGAWLADPEDAAAEARVAAAVERLFDGTLARWPKISPPAVSQHQADAWNEQIENQLVVMTGPPGVGKTTVLAEVTRLVTSVYGERIIGIAAPTGKAARRITQGLRGKGLNMEATTEHRMLGVSRNGRDGKGWGFLYDADNPLSIQFLIVDEWSMNDLRLTAALFDAIPPGCNVCLVGDTAQLPPVGGGAVLRDMVDAGLPRVNLTVPMRNGGLIGKALECIKSGGPVEFCDTLDPASGQNLKFIECPTDTDQLTVLNIVLKAIQAKPNVVLSQDVFVLTPRNEGSRVARKPLNEYLNLIFNPVHPCDVPGKAEGWRLRDRVICRSNTFTEGLAFIPGLSISDVNSYQTKQTTIYEPGKVFVANGDLGTVVAISKHRPEIIVRFDEPMRCVKWRMGGKVAKDETSMGGKKEDLQHACALSGHLMQGSEAPWILLMVDEGGGRVASKEYWYTSIGRARQACIIIGKRSAFEKQRRRAELPSRKTFLKELLLGVMPDESEAKNGDSGVGDMVEVGAEGENAPHNY